MRKFFLLIIILLLCSHSWAEVLSNEIIRSETERETEILNAINELGENISEIDKVNFQDGIKKSRNNFLRLYNARWKALGMTAKLEKSMNDAFAEHTQGMLWGTAGLQIGTNMGNVVNNIQESAAYNFSQPFDDFLRDLEEKWGESLQNEIAEFYQRTSIILIAESNNPITKAYIRQNTAAQDKGEKILTDINARLSAKYPDLKLTGATAAGGIALIFRKQLVNYLAKYAGKAVIFQKAAKSVIGRAIGKTLPVIGPIMLAWSLYDVASIAWNAGEDVKKMLHERNLKMYSSEMPLIYWDVMEPYVMDVLISSYGVLQNTKRQALEFADDPRIIELSQGLNDTDKIQLAERFSSVVNLLGNDKYDYVIDNFGVMIKEASSQNFRRLMNVLQQNNLTQAKEWLELAGTQYFDFYALLPREVWEKFPPSQNSLEILTWMSSKLTPSARNTAAKLSLEDLRWIINELPERYVPQLFGGRDTDANTIHYEILRLAEISDKDSRKPYLSEWEYRWAKYNLYIISAVVIFFLASLAKMLVPLFHRQAKTESKSESIVIYNQPPQQNVSRPIHDVKLRISPEFADEVKRTQWDISQTLLPAQDGSGDYIFTVKLESLDYISWWIKKHHENIEVISPEELKS